MIRKISVTAWLFIIQTLLILILGAYFHSTVVVVNDVHAPYFVSMFNRALFIFLSYSILFSLLYGLILKKDKQVLGLLHFICGIPLLIATFLNQFGFFYRVPTRYYANNDDSWLPDLFPICEFAFFEWFLGLFILGIVIFIMNFCVWKFAETKK